MNQRKQIAIFIAAVAISAILTYEWLGVLNEPEHRALVALFNSWGDLPVRVVDKSLFFGIGTILLYPVFLRPAILFAYKAAPMRIRFIPRKFLAANNLRIFFFSVLFATVSGLLIGIGTFIFILQGGPFVNGEFFLGMLMLLMGFLVMNFPYQFAEIRVSLKKKELLESIIAIALLLIGVICIFQAVIAEIFIRAKRLAPPISTILNGSCCVTKTNDCVGPELVTLQ